MTTTLTLPAFAGVEMTDVRFLVVYPESAPRLLDEAALTRYLSNTYAAGEEPFAEEGYASLYVIAHSHSPMLASLVSGGMSAYDSDDLATFTMRVVPATPGLDLAHVTFRVDGRS